MANSGGFGGHVWATALTANDSTAKEPLGAIRTEYDPTYGVKQYMYILAGSAIADGKAVIPSGVTGYTVAVGTAYTTAGARVRAAGVGIGTITNAYYGWIQIKGHKTKILVTIATGSSAAQAETVMGCSGVYSVAGAAATAKSAVVACGILTYTAAAAGKSTSGYIRCT